MDILTAFDWAVIVIIGLSGLLALFRGFVREVLSLAAWLAAAMITINYYDSVAAMLHPEHMSSKLMASGAATLGLFISVLLLIAIINSIIIRFLNAGGNISILDSLLGMVFGVMRGLFIVALAFLMLTVVMKEDDYPDWLGKAKTRPVVEASAQFLAQLAPGYVNNLSELTQEAADQSVKMKELQDKMEQLEKMQKDGTLNLDPKGYDEDKRKELERLLNALEQEKVAPKEAEKPAAPATP